MAYAYLNARLRAISGEILPSGKILDLSGLESLDDLSAGLEPAGYRFPPAEGFAPLQRVEAGIRERYAHRVARVRAMARGAGRSAELLIRGAIHRWDLHTLKTLLRGRIRRESAEETAAWTVPGVFFSDEVIRESLRLPSLPEMAAFWISRIQPERGSPGRRVREILRGFDFTQESPTAVEMALERAWITDVLASLDPKREKDRLAVRWVRLQVDRINLLTALRIAGEGGAGPGDPESWFVYGGEIISLPVFRGVLRGADPRDGGVASLPPPWGEVVSGALTAPLDAIPPLLDLELRWDAALLREFSREAVSDPLGIGPGFQLLQRALREMTALRLIASGIVAGFPGGIRGEWVRGIYR
ncbi:MAG: V-type ATPase subunit [Nitrospirae bacterium]|nr:V-type ATPase subunit [Nitrospirota bacterium]